MHNVVDLRGVISRLEPTGLENGCLSYIWNRYRHVAFLKRSIHAPSYKCLLEQHRLSFQNSEFRASHLGCSFEVHEIKSLSYFNMARLYYFILLLTFIHPSSEKEFILGPHRHVRMCRIWQS